MYPLKESAIFLMFGKFALYSQNTLVFYKLLKLALVPKWKLWQADKIVSSFSGINIREVEVHFGAKPLGCPTNAMAQNQNGK